MVLMGLIEFVVLFVVMKMGFFFIMGIWFVVLFVVVMFMVFFLYLIMGFFIILDLCEVVVSVSINFMFNNVLKVVNI